MCAFLLLLLPLLSLRGCEGCCGGGVSRIGLHTTDGGDDEATVAEEAAGTGVGAGVMVGGRPGVSKIEADMADPSGVTQVGSLR